MKYGHIQPRFTYMANIVEPFSAILLFSFMKQYFITLNVLKELKSYYQEIIHFT